MEWRPSLTLIESQRNARTLERCFRPNASFSSEVQAGDVCVSPDSWSFLTFFQLCSSTATWCDGGDQQPSGFGSLIFNVFATRTTTRSVAKAGGVRYWQCKQRNKCCARLVLASEISRLHVLASVDNVYWFYLFITFQELRKATLASRRCNQPKILQSQQPHTPVPKDSCQIIFPRSFPVDPSPSCIVFIESRTFHWGQTAQSLFYQKTQACQVVIKNATRNVEEKSLFFSVLLGKHQMTH